MTHHVAVATYILDLHYISLCRTTRGTVTVSSFAFGEPEQY